MSRPFWWSAGRRGTPVRGRGFPLAEVLAAASALALGAVVLLARKGR